MRPFTGGILTNTPVDLKDRARDVRLCPYPQPDR